MYKAKILAIFAIAGGALACSSTRASDSPGSKPVPAGTGGTGGSGPQFEDPGVVVQTTESNATATQRQTLEQKLAPVAELSTVDLMARYPATFAPAPSYDLSTVAGLSTIQSSNLALNAD